VVIFEKMCYNQVVVTHGMCSCIQENVLQPFGNTCECVPVWEKMCSYDMPFCNTFLIVATLIIVTHYIFLH
jgi:hypothetical protein